MKKRNYTKKSNLEKHSFYVDVEKVWKNKNHTYVYGYLRGAVSVAKYDEIYDDLMMLVGVQRILAASN